MRVTNLAFLVVGVAIPMSAGLYACGSTGDDGSSGGSSGGLGPDGSTDGPRFGDGGSTPPPLVHGSFAAPDCPGCTFPGDNAPACPAGAPQISLAYPMDGVLVPPNMNVISVQWTPFGGAFQKFEVDFESAQVDMRVVTKCATQTMDTAQPPTPSGGCELDLDPSMWKFMSDAARGWDPVSITVRGTTDGACANKSQATVRMSFASEDVLGAIYYWKSTVTANGVGGQIWVKSFGDSNPEQLVTTAAQATCYGCHALSRDGSRMVVYQDDDDSDDEYGDVRGSLIDMTSPTHPVVGNGAQPAGFSTLSPDHSSYLATNGVGNGTTNELTIWSGATGQQTGTVSLLAAGDRPTMPDWSPDGKTVVVVKPTKVGQWDFSQRRDDDHVFGGSLYTLPYNGGGQFGSPQPLVISAGENNYYPSYSPDGQFLIFNRAPQDNSAGAIDGCTGTAPQRSCPNDSFSNPAARLMLLSTTQSTALPIDLEAANGSPAASPQPLSNSWPRWSPFIQTYRQTRLLWVAFSSTRDYGLRVRNHKTGMYQCYPADSYEDPGAQHRQPFAASCQQPQLWMAAVNLSAAPHDTADPSYTAFWLPFQDITTHNHTPQWTQTIAGQPVPDAGTGGCVASGGNCQQNPSGCCTGQSCGADGTCQPILR